MLSNETDEDSHEKLTDFSSKSVKSSYRFYALDTLRAFAMLLGIILHSILAYSMNRFPAWPVQDSYQHSFFDFVLCLLHTFRLELFFLIAGFFANYLLNNKGLWQFLKNRFIRIAIPFVVSWPLTLMSLMLIRFKQTDVVTSFEIPIFHLWFLYYLLMLYPIFICFNYLMRISPKLWEWVDRSFSKLLQSPYYLGIFACFTAPILFLMDKSIVDTPLGFSPLKRLLFYYAIFFMCGILLQRQPNLLDTVAKQRRSYLYIAIPCIVFLSIALSKIALYPTNIGLSIVILRILYALVTWSLIFTFIGYFQQYFNLENPIIRYFATASYWFYLAHLPVVMCLQNVLLQTAIPGPLKPIIVFASSVIILLMSYHLVVRNTWIGNLLNGPKSNPVMPILRW